MRSEFRQQMHVGSRDAAVRDVADDRDFQIFKRALSLTNRECIEQRLRRMFVRAVAAIDDATLSSAWRGYAARRKTNDG